MGTGPPARSCDIRALDLVKLRKDLPAASGRAPSNILDLPPELLGEVFSLLDTRSHCLFGCASRRCKTSLEQVPLRGVVVTSGRLGLAFFNWLGCRLAQQSVGSTAKTVRLAVPVALPGLLPGSLQGFACLEEVVIIETAVWHHYVQALPPATLQRLVLGRVADPAATLRVVSKLTQLRTLEMCCDVSHEDDLNIPLELCQLHHLTHLSLTTKQFLYRYQGCQGLPPYFTSLQRLQRLHLDGGGIHEGTLETLASMPSLTAISLSTRHICEEMQELEARGVRGLGWQRRMQPWVLRCPAMAALQRLPHLRDLALDYPRAEAQPAGCGLLTQLTHLQVMCRAEGSPQQQTGCGQQRWDDCARGVRGRAHTPKFAAL